MQQKKESILDLSIGEKYMLTVREASVYFHIGIKHMRRLAENNDGEFALFVGNRYLICRPKFEEYLQKLMENPVRTGGELEKDDEKQGILQDRKDKRDLLENFIMNLQNLDGEQTEFQEEPWGGLLDENVAEKDKSCWVIFRGGIEVTI